MPVIVADELMQDYQVAIVVSRFNEEVTAKLYEGAVERLQELGFDEDQITVIWVPGAVELPFVAQRLASRQPRQHDAIIALGAVIRGETDHYDYVCQQASSGCQQVALEFNIPVIFGVLTTENAAQAFDRVGGAHGHTGREAADAAWEMLSVLEQVDEL